MEAWYEEKETRCEIDAITDDLYYHVLGQRVDKAKHSESRDDGDCVVDLMTGATMRQCKDRPAAQVNAVCKGTVKVAELLSVDLEMDGLKQNCGILDVAALLAVDKEVLAMTKRNKHEEELHDINELYLRLGGAANSREYNVPAVMEEDLDLTLHSREGVTNDIIMSELFAVDLEMEVRYEAKDTICDINAIMDLTKGLTRQNIQNHSR